MIAFMPDAGNYRMHSHFPLPNTVNIRFDLIRIFVIPHQNTLPG